MMEDCTRQGGLTRKWKAKLAASAGRMEGHTSDTAVLSPRWHRDASSAATWDRHWPMAAYMPHEGSNGCVPFQTEENTGDRRRVISAPARYAAAAMSAADVRPKPPS